MAKSDEIADDTTAIFTEADIYVIGGYLAETWDVEGDPESHVVDIDEAIQFALRDHDDDET